MTADTIAAAIQAAHPSLTVTVEPTSEGIIPPLVIVRESPEAGVFALFWWYVNRAKNLPHGRQLVLEEGWCVDRGMGLGWCVPVKDEGEAVAAVREKLFWQDYWRR